MFPFINSIGETYFLALYHFILIATAGCKVDENIEDCMATTKLKGECVYKSKHDKECNFKIVMARDRDQSLAYLMFGPKKRSILNPGMQYKDCADFMYGDDDVLVVKEKVCDCEQKGIERFKSMYSFM